MAVNNFFLALKHMKSKSHSLSKKEFVIKQIARTNKKLRKLCGYRNHSSSK